MNYGVKIENGVVVDRVLGVPTGYTQTDGTPQIGWLFDSTTGSFVAPEVPSKTWDDLRPRRDLLLTKSDFTQLPDTPLSSQKKSEYAAYRQKLRNLPQTYPDPNDVIWPTEPVL